MILREGCCLPAARGGRIRTHRLALPRFYQPIPARLGSLLRFMASTWPFAAFSSVSS